MRSTSGCAVVRAGDDCDAGLAGVHSEMECKEPWQCHASVGGGQCLAARAPRQIASTWPMFRGSASAFTFQPMRLTMLGRHSEVGDAADL